MGQTLLSIARSLDTLKDPGSDAWQVGRERVEPWQRYTVRRGLRWAHIQPGLPSCCALSCSGRGYPHLTLTLLCTTCTVHQGKRPPITGALLCTPTRRFRALQRPYVQTTAYVTLGSAMCVLRSTVGTTYGVCSFKHTCTFT